MKPISVDLKLEMLLACLSCSLVFLLLLLSHHDGGAKKNDAINKSRPKSKVCNNRRDRESIEINYKTNKSIGCWRGTCPRKVFSFKHVIIIVGNYVFFLILMDDNRIFKGEHDNFIVGNDNITNGMWITLIPNNDDNTITLLLDTIGLGINTHKFIYLL